MMKTVSKLIPKFLRPAPRPPENSIYVVKAYKQMGFMWVFDDERVNLKAEAFVGDVNTVIDAMTAHIPDAESGFALLFSPTPFPGFQVRLTWREPTVSRALPNHYLGWPIGEQDDGAVIVSGGNTYWCEKYQCECWFCPALFKYFPEAPPELYGAAMPLGKQTKQQTNAVKSR